MVEHGVFTQVERSFRISICSAASVLSLIVEGSALVNVQLVLT